MSCSRSSRRSCCFISIFCRDGREEQPSEPSGCTRREALALPTRCGGDGAFSQWDAIAELKAHMWLVEVETSSFQRPRRGAVCAGLLYPLGTLAGVPWMGAAPRGTFRIPVSGVRSGTLGGTRRGSPPAMAARF